MSKLPLAATAALAVGPLLAAQSDGVYRMPSAALAAIVDAPLTPIVAVSPDKSLLVLLERPFAPEIAELAEPELRLGGWRINPATNGPSRATHYTGVVVKRLAPETETRVTGFPAGAQIAVLGWSPDARHLSCTVRLTDRVELWLVELATAQARRLTPRPLNTVADTPTWMDGSTLVASFVPDDRTAPPQPPRVPSGPVVQENLGGKRPARTYQDLLANPHDEALFDHYAISEVALVGLDGAVAEIGVRGVVTNVAPSPDGQLLLVTQLQRPYSYLVPAVRFPTTIRVHDRAGRVVHTVAELPLAENIPIPNNSVRTGPRSVSWRADAPATLSWFEALDGGDAGRAAEWRDAWFVQAAPFREPPRSVLKLAYRAAGVTWGDDARAIVTENWWKTRRTRSWLVAPGDPAKTPERLFDRSSEDRYGSPGNPVLTRNRFGRMAIQFSPGGGRMYLEGEGASPEGNRPFLDELDLATKATRRLWRSQAPYYESFVSFADPEATRIFTRRESVREPANYFVRTLGVSDDSQALRALTRFADPLPQFASVHKELIAYRRADGVALSGTLYLPPGRKPGDGPLPTLLWAYPREFTSADAAGQIRNSPYEFIRVSPTGPLPYLLAGFAVLDDPTMPIVGGNGKEPNDSYVPQLIASAQAAIDTLEERGVGDRHRMAVGGHSYGAFMTGNLLAHSDLFRAGIARSGAYNRTLTPFGFQAEPRTYWQAPEVYYQMSPFNFAHAIKEPILLIHGTHDNNQGTFPIQSERMFAALKGNGGNVRYVQLPLESHGYAAKESRRHVIWEMVNWLDTHVKPAKGGTQ